MQIPFISLFLYYYKVFKRYTGKKLYLLISIIVIAGLAEGIGIALFIPLLSLSSSTSADKETINIYLYKVFTFFHIKPEFESILLLIAIVFLIKAIVVLIQEALSSYILSYLTMDLRNRMTSAYIGMKYSYYLNSNIGYLNNVITKEIERAVGAFGHYSTTIVALIYIFIYTTTSIIVNWQITVLVLFFSVCLLFPFKLLNNLSRRYSLLQSEGNAKLQEFLIQTIQYFKYLKATNSFRRVKSKLDNEVKLLAKYMFKLGLFGGSLKSLTEPFTIFFLLGLLFFQVSVMGKTVTEVLVIVLLFFRLITRVFTLQRTWQKFNAAVGGIDTFTNAFEGISKNYEAKGPTQVNQLNKEIALVNVSFCFGDQLVLSNINIKISKNQVVAIVGESGAGKSTLVDLITGLLKPESGSIYYDGIDYENIDPDSIRKMVGYVTQENVVFHDTIANNISLWEHHEDDEIYKSKVHKAAQAAYCYEYIKDKESGYDTIIGDRGIKLSGGQKQRLSIARELFKEPELLIFDEATSALDSESESFIQKSIDNLKGSRTIIIIAHRLSTIKNCDYVYVLNKGRIIEEGKYSELYDGNTKFRKMCLDQQL